MSNQLSVWDRQISIGNATVYNPPPGMVFHPVTKARLNPPALLAAPQLPAILPPYAIPPPYGWPQPFSPPPAPQPPVAPFPPAPATATATATSTATAATESVRFGSPASPGTDPYSLLEEYIKWTVARVPSACEDLESAKNTLLEERHDLVGISEFTDDDWERLGIQLGIGRRLRRDVHKFKQERQRRY